MTLRYLLLISRQGKCRLAKWYTPMTTKAKAKTIQEVTQMTIGRPSRACNFLEYKGRKASLSFVASAILSVVYKRYASLLFVGEIAEDDNELIVLEIIHRYVEVLDGFFGNVCELDIIHNFLQAYSLLDELVMGGNIQESSRKVVLNAAQEAESYELDDDLITAAKNAGFL